MEPQLAALFVTMVTAILVVALIWHFLDWLEIEYGKAFSILVGILFAVVGFLLMIGLGSYLTAWASPAGTDRSAEPAGTPSGPSADRP